LVSKGAALMLEEKNLNKALFIKLVDDILKDNDRYNEMKTNVSKLGITDSSSRIYEVLKDLILNDKKFY
jgi:UDP-N-acetylglucosamine--N-acetylmuramyl-(pentapeptide) pyrophosphoryl-undecaprenol N-acetylglucosamine transferase